MKYIKTQWHHSDISEPIQLYSELDDERWEVRKVEIFADGRKGWASISEETQLTFLGLVPVPSLEEIRSDPQFEVWEISKEEFEAVWHERMEQEKS